MLQPMPNLLNLPTPSAAALAHSARLSAAITADIISSGGCVSFRRFMELALYAPGLGYYSAGAHKFGAEGDFVTAPELGNLFAHCMARQCQEIMEHTSSAHILECGAGTGALAAEMLRAWEQWGCLPERYSILEVSAELRARQAQTLRARVPALVECVEWLDELPASGFRGVIVANEVLDAMPVDYFVLQNGKVYQRGVIQHGDAFAFNDHAMADDALQLRIAELRRELSADNFADGYTSEVNFSAEAWLASVAQTIECGAVLLVDYGFPAREYYHPQRDKGTLMCHYRHRAHADPLILPGLQDITAHVDFTAMAQAAHTAGCDVLGYVTQAQFLLNCGLLERVASMDTTDTRAYLALTNEVKKLTLPSEMGELFKVLAIGKNIDINLLGFVSGDQRGRL